MYVDTDARYDWTWGGTWHNTISTRWTLTNHSMSDWHARHVFIRWVVLGSGLDRGGTDVADHLLVVVLVPR
jgi:hypothetical protein